MSGMLVTERLRLAPLVPNEADELHALWTEPAVRRYLWGDRILTPSHTLEVLRQSEECWHGQGWGLCSVRQIEVPRMIGFGGYWYVREPPELELVLGLGTGWWNRGFATEAGRRLIRYAFEQLRLPEVCGSTAAANVRSRRLMERLGMRFVRQESIDGRATMFYRIGPGPPKEEE
jgi:[ribosomal protein S5]-alanine N-acetyltransferase